MCWYEDLKEDIKKCAEYKGSNARLLAGPGTGKTLSITAKIHYFLKNKLVDSAEEILVLTFTKAAARDLVRRIQETLGDDVSPRALTIHSFALQHILINSGHITYLPKPIRIADDWEEDNIIHLDLQNLLRIKKKEVKRLFTEMSSDWQSLKADEERWNVRFPNPQFIGAWQEHRSIYGYSLRSELVYQLKRLMEQSSSSVIQNIPKYLIIDEYQDLNKCELDVINKIYTLGAELFVAGDDDQSIYGFRMAFPEGIRRFNQDYPNVKDLQLTVCTRCAPEILQISDYIARLDYERIDKNLMPEDNKKKGVVRLINFKKEEDEANGISNICKNMINKYHKPEEILILLRSDYKGVFSRLIQNSLINADVPVNRVKDENPLDSHYGRQILAFLRLIDDINDNLSWRTLFNLRTNRIGKETINTIYDLAKTESISFKDATKNIEKSDKNIFNRINPEITFIKDIINRINCEIEPTLDISERIPLIINKLCDYIIPSGEAQESTKDFYVHLFDDSQADSLNRFLKYLETNDPKIEQEMEKNCVNIMTMHKAKGLSADIVIIPALEDELIPGKNTGEFLGDERRLLYVSLTRARNYLLLTYCNKRLTRQRYSGRESGKIYHQLTRFLKDSHLEIHDGSKYLSSASFHPSK